MNIWKHFPSVFENWVVNTKPKQKFFVRIFFRQNMVLKVRYDLFNQYENYVQEKKQLKWVKQLAQIWRRGMCELTQKKYYFEQVTAAT